jgi:hypothetical protein
MPRVFSFQVLTASSVLVKSDPGSHSSTEHIASRADVGGVVNPDS